MKLFKKIAASIFGICLFTNIVYAEQITLKVMSTTIVEKPEGEVEQKFADEFMKRNPDIKIEFIGTPMNSLYAKLQTVAIGGELPDIFTNTPEFAAKSREMGITADLESLLEKSYIEGFYPSILDQTSIDGKLEVFPFFTIPMGMLYRADWFKEEGIEKIENWEDFVTAAGKLTKDTDGDGKVDRWGFAMVGSRNGSGGGRFAQILRSFGAYELAKRNGEWQTDIDSKESRDAFKFFTELYTKHKVVPPGPTEVSYGEAISLMASGKTAMMITGPHSIGAILAQNPELAGKIYSDVIPKGSKNVSNLSIGGFSISSTSEHKDAAAKYLKFIVETEQGLEWNRVTGRMPSRIEAGSQPQISGPIYEGFVNALEYVEPLPTSAPFYSQITGDILGEAYQSIMVGGVSVEEATDYAAERIRELIDEN